MLTVVASENGKVGLPSAWKALQDGATALDAVEVGVRAVEDNPDDHSVGYAGHPNIDGVVELDASIMDGATRRAGAVGGLRGYRHAITVARAVMERTPHALIVGDGAARLAREIGEAEEDLLTEGERAYWQAGVGGARTDMLARIRQLTRDPRDGAGTVDFLAIDSEGHIASAVSTSGLAFKHPGRLGDSPVIGAGNYCDDRYGAAACTGWGELAIRAATAHTAVMAMAAGASPTEAASLALSELFALPTDGVPPLMHIVVLSPSGEHAAATTLGGARYAWQDETTAGHAIAERLVIGPEVSKGTGPRERG
jgi:L-asparaginase / beta-aspartyl-peptidase